MTSQNEMHALAVSKGWWDGYERDEKGRVIMTTDQLLAKLALIHSEVSEALEDARVGKMERFGGDDDDYDGSSIVTATKPVGFPTELADIVIRCMDLAGAMGIDLDEEIRTKSRFNATRPARHGGKLA